MRKCSILISLVILLAIAFQARATIIFGNPATGDLEDIISGIFDYIFIFGMILFPIIILFGAFSFMASGGDPSKIQKAKNLIFYSLIGLFILLLAKNIGFIINSLLGFK